MTCYNISRIQPVMRLYRTLDELCVWKLVNHRAIEGFKMCVSCPGYDLTRDCYFSHKSMDQYLIEGGKNERD